MRNKQRLRRCNRENIEELRRTCNSSTKFRCRFSRSAGWKAKMSTPKGRSCLKRGLSSPTLSMTFAGNAFKELSVDLKAWNENRYRAGGFGECTQEAFGMTRTQFGFSVQADSRNRFSLKFKTNWRRDETRPDRIRSVAHFVCEQCDQVSAFLQTKNRWQSFLSASSSCSVDFDADTYEADEHSQESNNLVRLDPQKHKTYRKTETGERNEAQKYKNNSFVQF